MRSLVLIIPLLFSLQSFSQNVSKTDKDEILFILHSQQLAWNRGDIVEFMDGYWKSDSLKFIGKKGLTFGWKNTLENYKASYPDRMAMGTLEFDIVLVEELGKDFAFVVGKWSLKRESDNPSGFFTLTWKRIEGRWVIVADHSS